MEVKEKKTGRYIARFLLFLLFMFIFDRGLYYLLNRMEKNFYPPKSDFEKHFEFYMADKSFSTLIFGTSRTYEGIHPAYFEEKLGEKAFKETFQGKGPKYNYYFYQLYKKYAGVPKVVIYGVDYFIYTVISDPKWLSRFDIEDSHERPGLFSNPLLLLRHKREIDNFQNNIMIGLKETWETNPEDNAEIEENPFKNIDIIQNYKGVELPGKKLVTQREGITRKVVFHPYPGKEGKYFMKLMEQLDRDGVIVVLVALPDYIGSYKTNYQRLEFIRHLKTLKRNYKRLFIYNYNKPRRFPLANTDYFNDGGFGMANSHLSQKGAEVFCNILIDDIRKHYNK